MQTAGTTEGLRNLIDSNLLGSIKLIMMNPNIFGSQLFGLGSSLFLVVVLWRVLMCDVL